MGEPVAVFTYVAARVIQAAVAYSVLSVIRVIPDVYFLGLVVQRVRTRLTIFYPEQDGVFVPPDSVIEYHTASAPDTDCPLAAAGLGVLDYVTVYFKCAGPFFSSVIRPVRVDGLTGDTSLDQVVTEYIVRAGIRGNGVTGIGECVVFDKNGVFGAQLRVRVPGIVSVDDDAVVKAAGRLVDNPVMVDYAPGIAPSDIDCRLA